MNPFCREANGITAGRKTLGSSFSAHFRAVKQSGWVYLGKGAIKEAKEDILHLPAGYIPHPSLRSSWLSAVLAGIQTWLEREGHCCSLGCLPGQMKRLLTQKGLLAHAANHPQAYVSISINLLQTNSPTIPASQGQS